VAKSIEAVDHSIVPYTRFSTPTGEGVTFDTIKIIRLLIKYYGLEDAATHIPIGVCIYSDDVPVTKSMGVLTQGISFNDAGAISPWKNRPLCLSETKGTQWDEEDN
jgi:hypothetical protein